MQKNSPFVDNDSASSCQSASETAHSREFQ